LTDWITANEAAPLLAIMPTQLAYYRRNGLLKKTQRSGPNRTDPVLYDRAEVEAMRSERVASGEQVADLVDVPLGGTHVRTLAYVQHCGGAVFGDSLTPVVAAAVDVDRSTIGNVIRDLACLSFIDKDSGGAHITRLALTTSGRAWIAKHSGRVAAVTFPAEKSTLPDVIPAIADEPPPEPPPEARAIDPPPPPVVEAPALDRLTADAIAASMLRQAAHVLADSDVSALRAECDVLRSHVEAMTRRLDQVTAERDRAEAENREVRAVLHGIESELTPLLVGRDARFDYLDATTRTELLRVVGDAARWASAS
jgi:hypothetical protein